MARDEIVDPLSRALADLPQATPDTWRTERVRRRCLNEWARQRAPKAASPRRMQMGDVLIAGGAALYALAAIAQGVQLLITAGR